uniref:Dehydrogenase/reductase SDR family member 11 n=1 Tax=Photinus pyralis TaxID=7054 RepID=A0A1Y1MHG4_PHOPY
MERFNGKVAIVTGASSGIGKAIASQLVEEGMNVAGLARRKEKLEELRDSLGGLKGVFHPVPVDMSKEADIIQAFDYVAEHLGAIHVLVNSAGCSRITPLSCGETDNWKDIFDINVIGLSIATREALKNMAANQTDGHIVHINSIYGHYATKLNNSMYCASKFAVTALTESLRCELIARKSRTKITSISPGYVETEFMDVLSKTSNGLFSKELLHSFRHNNPYLKPEDVANCVLYALKTPPHVQVHDVIIRPIGEKI